MEYGPSDTGFGDHDEIETVFRPLQAEDAVALQALFGRLSDETVRKRFLAYRIELSAVEAEFFADVDHSDREAIAAVQGEDIIGVARYDRVSDDTAEAAIVVQDDQQHHGYGTDLALFLIDRALRAGIQYFALERLGNNDAVVALIAKLGLEQVGKSETRFGVATEKVRIK